MKLLTVAEAAGVALVLSLVFYGQTDVSAGL